MQPIRQTEAASSQVKEPPKRVKQAIIDLIANIFSKTFTKKLDYEDTESIDIYKHKKV